jgi:hypothetical protein
MVHFEKNDLYQGIALAMPPGRKTLTASAAEVRRSTAAAAKAEPRAACGNGMPQGMPGYESSS